MPAPDSTPTYRLFVNGVEFLSATETATMLYGVQAETIVGSQAKADAAQASAVQRANHTGTQAIATIDGLTAALASRALETSLSNLEDNFDFHRLDEDNPHKVSKNQVGLGSADNTADANKPVSTAQATAISAAQTAATTVATTHAARMDNPHAVTKAQVGLGSADNTADTAKPVSTLQATAISAAQANATTAAAADATNKSNAVIPNYIAPTALTSSAAISWDAANKGSATLAHGHNTTITVSNLLDGQSASISGTVAGAGLYSVALAHAGLTVRVMSGTLASIALLPAGALWEISIKRDGAILRAFVTTFIP